MHTMDKHSKIQSKKTQTLMEWKGSLYMGEKSLQADKYSVNGQKINI